MTGARLRRRLHGADGQAGVSLVELLVVSIVSMIVLGAVGVTFQGSLSASRRATSHTSATADARLALDVLARRLRVVTHKDPSTATSSLFVSAPASLPAPAPAPATTALSFYASLEPAAPSASPTPASSDVPLPSLVEYVVDDAAHCLRERITPNAGAGTTQSRCLAFGDAITATFTYSQVTHLPTALVPTPTPAPTATLAVPAAGLTAAQGLSVGAVRIVLTWRARGAPATSRPFQLETRVLLANPLNEEIP